MKDGYVTVKVTLNRQTVDGVVYKPELYSIGGGYDYYEVEMKKLFYWTNGFLSRSYALNVDRR